MMKQILLFFTLIFMISVNAQTSVQQDKKEILDLLRTQEKAWNNYDLEGFMQGYWRSENLKFYGSSGVTSGWEQILANYHKRYPTKDHTGTLKFKINAISRIENNSYYVMGEYFLTRKAGDVNGIFMIIIRKINGKWKIIADTSC